MWGARPLRPPSAGGSCPEAWVLGRVSPRSWGAEAGGGGGQSGPWTRSPPLGFEDAVTDEAQALGKAGNQALGPATEQGGHGEPHGRDHRRGPLRSVVKAGRAPRPSKLYPARGSQRAEVEACPHRQRWAQAAAAPGRAECHHECHRPAASRLMALGNAPGCSVTFQLQRQGLTEPGGPVRGRGRGVRALVLGGEGTFAGLRAAVLPSVPRTAKWQPEAPAPGTLAHPSYPTGETKPSAALSNHNMLPSTPTVWR